MHVTLRVLSEVGNLRRDEVYRAVREASRTAAQRARFRIIHLSLQHDHIHLLVEAESAALLASGMHGFKISAARHINTALAVDGLRRRGRVFADRYHVVVIRSPSQARNVLAYILQNWRKHGEDRRGIARTWLVDRFSSGILFAGWKELEGKAPWTSPPGYEALVVASPQSWLSGAVAGHAASDAGQPGALGSRLAHRRWRGSLRFNGGGIERGGGPVDLVTTGLSSLKENH